MDPARRFEAVVFDWDGTAVADRRAPADTLRVRLEALLAASVDLVVVTGTNMDNIDRQLRCRPSGPGRLLVSANRGSETWTVGPNGPELLWRRTATETEDRALDDAAALTAARLRGRGLDIAVVADRLNRRKLDLIPDAAWRDPPKARIVELVEAVHRRLGRFGLDLPAAVDLARSAAAEVGLADARVTSDVKHVEIGLTDKSDAARWAFAELSRRGIGPGLVLVVGDEFGELGGMSGSDALLMVPGAQRATVLSVGVEPAGVPDGVVHVDGGPERFVALMEHQLELRDRGAVPEVDEDEAWSLAFVDAGPEPRRVRESLLCLAGGRIGTRGAREEEHPGATPLTVLAGVYDDAEPPRLLAAPNWTSVELTRPLEGDRRVLDLRTGTLRRDGPAASGYASFRFVSLARPGVAALRVAAPEEFLVVGPPLRLSTGDRELVGADGDELADADGDELVVAADGGGIAAAARQRSLDVGGRRALERLAGYVGAPDAPAARALVERAADAGFDALLAEHRRCWSQRWEDSLVRIEGDPEAQLAVRFALFHLLSSVADGDEAAVGARGLSGPGYAGHVFWDADVFVLPTMAAIHPAAARAMVEYRRRRLPGARAEAAAQGFAGALFPWESAQTGREVTPRQLARDDGSYLQIRTGDTEDHIVADVAWAADRYATWTGDDAYLRGPGRELLTETARYWASRISFDAAGRAHISQVIGPDEYHEGVDDNAFTNIMARWNLRRGAGAIDPGNGTERDEAARWLDLADRLVDGFDVGTGRYEQFAGFFALEPLLIGDFAEPPIAADLLLGRGRVQRSQVVKQADVLMAHYMVPDEMAPGSLAVNLAFYVPRTAHGSSLSPAIHAALLAQAGRAEEALALFGVAARLDLDDITGSTAGGLHLATMGGLWQALAFGFLGIAATDHGGLRMAPQLPSKWSEVEVRFFFRRSRVVVVADRRELRVTAAPPLTVTVGSRQRTVGERPVAFKVAATPGSKDTGASGTGTLSGTPSPVVPSRE